MNEEDVNDVNEDIKEDDIKDIKEDIDIKYEILNIKEISLVSKLRDLNSSSSSVKFEITNLQLPISTKY